MNESSNTNSCVIELHYCLNDGSHSMDAFIFNECEREFLNIIMDVIKKSGVKVEVEVEALGQGGLRSKIRFIVKNKKNRDFVLKLIMAAMISFVSGAFGELGKICVDSMFDSPKTPYPQEHIDEISDIMDFKEVKEICMQYIDGNIPFWKRRSNYYEYLNLCEKVEELILSIEDETGTTSYFQHKVERSRFTEFIISDYEFEPKVDKNAIIENIYCVRNGRKYKWEGRYNGKSIRFNFKDGEQIECNNFYEGSSIKCQLEIHRRIGNGGRVRKEYEVISVQ